MKVRWQPNALLATGAREGKVEVAQGHQTGGISDFGVGAAALGGEAVGLIVGAIVVFLTQEVVRDELL